METKPRTMSTKERSRLARLRRAAAYRGHRIWKLRTSEPQYAEHGPYAVVDIKTNGVVASQLDLDGLEKHYQS